MDIDSFEPLYKLLKPHLQINEQILLMQWVSLAQSHSDYTWWGEKTWGHENPWSRMHNLQRIFKDVITMINSLPELEIKCDMSDKALKKYRANGLMKKSFRFVQIRHWGLCIKYNVHRRTKQKNRWGFTMDPNIFTVWTHKEYAIITASLSPANMLDRLMMRLHLKQVNW